MLTKKLKVALVAMAFALLAVFEGGYVIDSFANAPAIVVVADGGSNIGPPGGG